MNKSIAILLSCAALVALVCAAWPAGAGELKAEQLLEIYHSRGLPPTVAPPVKKVLLGVVAALEEGDEGKALAIWRKLWERYPTEFSPVERARMKRWVLRRAYLTKGKPLYAEIVAWEEEHQTPSAQRQAIPQLKLVMDRRAKVVQTLSNILKKMSTTSDTIVSNLK
jgi:hypothetical protein